MAGNYRAQFYLATALFGLNLNDAFTHGVMLSLGVNLFCYIFVSQVTSQRVVERIQASLFVDSVETRQTSVNRPWTGATTVGDLKVLCERFLGANQVTRAFDDYARRTGKPLEDRSLRFSCPCSTLNFSANFTRACSKGWKSELRSQVATMCAWASRAL